MAIENPSEGDWAAAWTHAKEALIAYPDDKDTLVDVAQVAYRSGHQGAAKDILIQASVADELSGRIAGQPLCGRDDRRGRHVRCDRLSLSLPLTFILTATTCVGCYTIFWQVWNIANVPVFMLVYSCGNVSSTSRCLFRWTITIAASRRTSRLMR